MLTIEQYSKNLNNVNHYKFPKSNYEFGPLIDSYYIDLNEFVQSRYFLTVAIGLNYHLGSNLCCIKNNRTQACFWLAKGVLKPKLWTVVSENFVKQLIIGKVFNLDFKENNEIREHLVLLLYTFLLDKLKLVLPNNKLAYDYALDEHNNYIDLRTNTIIEQVEDFDSGVVKEHESIRCDTTYTSVDGNVYYDLDCYYIYNYIILDKGSNVSLDAQKLYFTNLLRNKNV